MSNGNKAIFLFIRFAFGILIFLVIIYAAAQLATVGYDFGYRVFTEPAVSSGEGREVPVLVSEGMTDKEFAETLEQKGLIRNANLFYLQMKLFAYSDKKLPGVYTLNTAMDPKALMIAVSTDGGQDAEDTENTESAEETETAKETEGTEETESAEASGDGGAEGH